MMLIVLAVTGTTLYLAERNTQARYQEGLDTRFQSQMRLFTELQEAQLQAITERCRTLSHSVRLRAALEERDVDDLYRNALTELQGIFGKLPHWMIPVRKLLAHHSFVFSLRTVPSCCPPSIQPV